LEKSEAPAATPSHSRYGLQAIKHLEAIHKAIRSRSAQAEEIAEILKTVMASREEKAFVFNVDFVSLYFK
jgi:hypothetical protein